MAQREQALEALLSEERTFAPTEEFRAQANASDAAIYERAAADPEGFWAEWRVSWTGSSRGPRCSSGSRRTPSGSSAASSTRRYNCLDRHLARAAPEQGRHLIWEGEPGDAPGR